MVTLGLVCLFVSFILLIMGLMAWGAMAPPLPPEDAKQAPNRESEQASDTPPAPGDK